MKKGIVSISICVGIVAAGAALIVAAKQRHDAAEAAGRKAMEAAVVKKAPNVRVRTLEAHTVEDRVILTGRVEPWEDVELSAEVSGKIEWQGIEEGDQVVAGQELVKIDTESIRVQLDQARAQHKLAVQELARAKDLEKEGIGSPQSLDRAITERDVAAANVRALEVEVTRSVVTAPIDGAVDRLEHEQAEFVDRGTLLVRLVQVHKVKVEVGIPERDIPFFTKGDAVTVTVDALPGEGFEGTIHRIATTADTATRTFAAEIELDNRQGSLMPGMIARVRLVRRSYPDAIAIPLFAVISLEDRYIVYIEADGLAEQRDVEVGIFQEDWVHITKGLSDGDRLIVSGQRNVRPGEPVRVMEEVTE